MSGYGACFWCGRRVLWARTPKGRKVPLDLDSDQLRGKWRLEAKRDPELRYVVYMRRPEDEVLFACHYDTCERKPGPVRRIDPKTGAVPESE